ncbi:ATP-binding protein [Halarcobacter sp.]|uniref:ATP-binding protein n=1 Tax=Halarcobacter sp. TaxID=2321133 RepID=UPI002AABF82E|nr:ATP-binding protein [Halarcobacter sp.]
MKKNLIIKFSILYFLITTLLITLYVLQYEKNIINYLDKKTNQHLLQFKAIYDEYKVLSNLIFDTDINTDQTINIFKKAYKSDELEKNKIREKLLNHLALKYEKLKIYNLKQLHFHLPNNESFLRMHRPKKYGDNLTDIRSTVKYVNEYKKYIDGFEEGRIFNGFRFVYPLFTKENEHIGSVEISFSVLAMVETMYKTYDLNLSFLIRKDIVEKKLFKDELHNYIDSPNKDFYFEKSIYNKYPPISTSTNSKDYTDILTKGKPFSVLENDLNIVKTMIPIKNPISKEVVAVLCICEPDKFMLNDRNELVSKIIVSYLLLALVFFLFYKQALGKDKLMKLNKELDKKVSLEVRRGRKQDIHIFNQSKMASIGRMITNISHQWRQPLSIITTCASGLKIEKEMNMLDNKHFESFTNSILKQAEYLSKTLDSFREYIEVDDKKKEPIEVKNNMDKILEFLNPTFRDNNIKILKKYDEDDIYIFAVKSELIEIFNAILTNSKDAFEKNQNISSKTIDITIRKKNKEDVLITIKDNAGGIDTNIIDKIFDPYFTTKHESIGTGISLYLTYKLVTESLEGNIYVKNKDKGAKFYLEFPLFKIEGNNNEEI